MGEEPLRAEAALGEPASSTSGPSGSERGGSGWALMEEASRGLQNTPAGVCLCPPCILQDGLAGVFSRTGQMLCVFCVLQEPGCCVPVTSRVFSRMRRLVYAYDPVCSPGRLGIFAGIGLVGKLEINSLVSFHSLSSPSYPGVHFPTPSPHILTQQLSFLSPQHHGKFLSRAGFAP